MTGTAVLGVLALALGSRGIPAGPAQAAPEVRLAAVRVTPAEVPFGGRFEVTVSLRVPPGLRAYAPDSLAGAPGVESLGTVRWSSRPAPGDSLDVALAYPLLAVREGEVRLPALPLGLAPAESAGLGRWSDVSAEEAPRLLRRELALGSAGVRPLLPPGDAATELRPAAAADVLGADWSPWLLGSLGLVGMALLGGVGASLRRWLSPGAWRERLSRARAPSPRQVALRELDEIRSMGLHGNGRVDEFYALSTDVARRYARSLAIEWGPDLTSSELLARLSERLGEGSVEPLARAVEVAELVKFGRLRPDRDAAERDWTAVREWIRRAP